MCIHLLSYLECISKIMKCVFIGLYMFAISLLVHRTCTLFNICCMYVNTVCCWLLYSGYFHIWLACIVFIWRVTVAPYPLPFSGSPLYLIFEHAHFQLTGVLTIPVVIEWSPRNTADVDLAWTCDSRNWPCRQYYIT